MKILAQILAMADEEIIGMISPRTIRDIKREDPNPVFKVFRVGQEGESTPKIVGIGTTVQRWVQSAIEKLTEKLGLGTPVYHNHMPTNKEKNRPPIGEVVGKALKNMEGFLSSIAVIYVYPAFKDLPLDLASIEAGVMVPQDSKEFDIRDIDIKEVTGIALGNSRINKPAFPGATLLAQLQAMAGKGHTEGGTGMTKEEIIAEIKNLRLNPSDLFQPTQIIADPIVVEHVKERTVGEYAHRMRTDEAFQKAKTDWEKERKNLQDELASSKSSGIKIKAKEVFDTVLGERPKLKEDPKLVKFVRKTFEKSFQVADETKIKDELNKFVDDQVKEFTDIMGDGKGGGGELTDAEKAAAAAVAAEQNRNKTNLLDPKNNELIPAL